ncbi:MAG: response regulator [Acidimicrobiales bacterium]|nr:response regulator [Acidimicrobiales bacterium]
MTPGGPIRVVVVEDSSSQRAHLVRALQTDGDIVVVGEAESAPEAIEAVERLRPDVITLDLVIPDGGGRYAIEQIMARTPTPILVLSATFDSRHSTPAIDTLVAGALDAFPKPRRWTAPDEKALRQKLRSLKGVTVVRHPRGHIKSSSLGSGREPRCPTHPLTTGHRVVAIAASTGGPPALATILSGLGSLRAPVLVVQHIHPDFVDSLVDWMDNITDLKVCRAHAGERLEPSTVYIGPGGVHLRVDSQRRILLDPEPLTLHRPSANELLSSLARHVGRDGIGVVLTGMGEDGADGLLELRRAGGTTIAQDAASSTVFGMPRAADRIGAAASVVPVRDIAGRILRATQYQRQ